MNILNNRSSSDRENLEEFLNFCTLFMEAQDTYGKKLRHFTLQCNLVAVTVYTPKSEQPLIHAMNKTESPDFSLHFVK